MYIYFQTTCVFSFPLKLSICLSFSCKLLPGNCIQVITTQIRQLDHYALLWSLLFICKFSTNLYLLPLKSQLTGISDLRHCSHVCMIYDDGGQPNPCEDWAHPRTSKSYQILFIFIIIGFQFVILVGLLLVNGF